MIYNLKDNSEYSRKISLKIDSIIRKNMAYHTCQIFEKGGQYKFKPLGSGVCINLKNNFLILTASHVSSEIDDYNNLFIKTKNGYIPIRGKINSTVIENSNGMDLSYIRLQEGCASIITKTFTFLSYDKIAEYHQFINAANYLILGFPEKNIKISLGKMNTGLSYYLLRPTKNEIYGYYNFNPELFYLLEFKGKGEDMKTNQRVKINDPYGMSGCGLWYLSVIEEDNKEFSIDYYLIGIMSELRKGKYHVVIGNKIEHVISSILFFENIHL